MAEAASSRTWRGLRVSRQVDATGPARVELVTDLTDEALPSGNVWIDVEYSSLNYKDGLALCGRPGIIRAPQLIPGIDLVGRVRASDSAEWMPGARVLVTGCGIGETHDGGLAERARVDSAWLVPVPEDLSTWHAAAIGTAGFTAMLAVLALERGAATEEVLVTGAAGGVGSIAIALLAGLGHRVTAVTGRASEHDYLRGLGAAQILDRSELTEPGKPLQSQRWFGAIDCVGGDILANVLSQVRYGGTVAACGNAASSSATISLMPFLLRSVSLVGINSVETPRALRLEAWQRLAGDLDRGLLDSLSTTIGLGETIPAAERILAGQLRGRTVVDVRA